MWCMKEKYTFCMYLLIMNVYKINESVYEEGGMGHCVFLRWDFDGEG